MSRPVGSQATLNGNPVVWSGENYGWQSPESHNKLQEQGKFRTGTQALDRLTNAVVRLVGQDNIDKMTAGAENATAPARAIMALTEYLPLNSVGAARRFSDGIDRLTNIATQAVAEGTNTDPRIVGAVVTAGTALAGGASAAARRGARSFGTVATRQAQGRGIPNGIGRLRTAAQQRVQRVEAGQIGSVYNDRNNPTRALQQASEDAARSGGYVNEIKPGKYSVSETPRPTTFNAAPGTNSVGIGVRRPAGTGDVVGAGREARIRRPQDLDSPQPPGQPSPPRESTADYARRTRGQNERLSPEEQAFVERNMPESAEATAAQARGAARNYIDRPLDDLARDAGLTTHQGGGGAGRPSAMRSSSAVREVAGGISDSGTRRNAIANFLDQVGGGSRSSNPRTGLPEGRRPSDAAVRPDFGSVSSLPDNSVSQARPVSPRRSNRVTRALEAQEQRRAARENTEPREIRNARGEDYNSRFEQDNERVPQATGRGRIRPQAPDPRKVKDGRLVEPREGRTQDPVVDTRSPEARAVTGATLKEMLKRAVRRGDKAKADRIRELLKDLNARSSNEAPRSPRNSRAIGER